MAAARRRPDAYRCEGDTYLIEIRLRELRQLFNTLDPAPFHEKDLEPAAARRLPERRSERELVAAKMGE